MLKTAVIVEDHSGADEVGLNNTVQVYCEDDDELETYRIVTSVRGSSLNGLISIESPIGKEFGYHVVIKKIENTQDEDADKIRSF